MPKEAKDEQRRQHIGVSDHAMVTRSLRDCWSEPTDTFITEDIPLLLTRLSRIPAVPGARD